MSCPFHISSSIQLFLHTRQASFHHGRRKSHSQPCRLRLRPFRCPQPIPLRGEHQHDAGAIREAVSGAAEQSQGTAERYVWKPDTDVRQNLTLDNDCSVTDYVILYSALVGFLMALTPLSCALMGWRGAGGDGAATMCVKLFT